MQFSHTAESFYEQWRRLHDIKLDDLNPEVRETKSFYTKKKRMFKLELTDGYKTIHAMEMKPVKCLNTKLKPGTKVLITGPVKVVNAIIFLEPQNIKIIGGEVDDLLIINAYENVLLKLLRRDTVDNPIKEYKEPGYEDEHASHNVSHTIVPIPMNTHSTATANQPPIATENDEFFDDEIDFDLIDAIEARENQNKLTNENLLMPDEDEEKLLEQIDLHNLNQQQLLSRQPPPPTPQVPVNAPKANDLLIPNVPIEKNDDENADSMEIDFTEMLAGMSRASQNLPKNLPTFKQDDYAFKIDNTYNFVIIDQYVTLSKREKMERQYAIEAKIKKVIKLKIEGSEWVLVADMIDIYSKNTLQVRFPSNIVADFAKRSAAEMNLLREKLKTQPQLKMDLTAALTSVNNAIEDKLFLLGVTMNMKLPADYEIVVTSILEKTSEAMQVIILKIEDEHISLV